MTVREKSDPFLYLFLGFMIQETEFVNIATKSALENALDQEPTTVLFARMFAMVHTVCENVRCPNITRAKSANLVMKTVLAVARVQGTHLEMVDVIPVKRQLLACMIQTWLSNV